MQNQTVVVTGANSGIGFHTSLELLKRGATVGICARDRKRGEQALAELRRRSGSDRAELLLADLGSLQEVADLAGRILEHYPRVDVLINNAGIVLGERRVSVDGNEMVLAVNHLAPFLLTNLLLDRLEQSAPARIVNVSSRAHTQGRVDFDDLQCEHGYAMMARYGETKLMNILFTRELARRLEGKGVTANCLHPGVVRTAIGADGDLGRVMGLIWKIVLRFAGISPERGAETSVYLASSPEVEARSGDYYDRCKVARTASRSQDAEAAQRLWAVSEELTAGFTPTE